MSVGTGLGLSIVRQLVKDLGGNIDLQSEKCHGTKVKVVVPLESITTPEPELLENVSMVLDTKTRCKGLTICLVGFSYYPELGDTPTGILSAEAQRTLAFKASTTAYAVKWFGMSVTTAPESFKIIFMGTYFIQRRCGSTHLIIHPTSLVLHTYPN